jgi:protein TonB
VKLRSQAALLLTELKKANALNVKPGIQQPAFPGGKQVMLTFLNRNMKPVAELNNGERKTAIVQFQVREDGSLADFLISQSAGVSFDNELLRILQRMPKWKPALQNGKQVPVVVTQPVTIYKAEGTLKVEI